MRLSLLSAAVVAVLVPAVAPHEATASPMRMVASPMSGIEQVYYYHGHHYPYHYHGGYYAYRYHGAYYRNRSYAHGHYRYY
jgi:hypothetical protein